MPERTRDSFDTGPHFAASEVAALFGVDMGKPVGWITAGLLAATGNGQAGRSARYQVAPSDVLRFVREHPDTYDWLRITDASLRAEAERIERADPLLPLADVAARANPMLPLAEVEEYARRGLFPTVARRGGGKGGRLALHVRRSNVAAAVEAIAAEQRRGSPLAVLHDLLTVPLAMPPNNVNGAMPALVLAPLKTPAIGIAREAVQAARLGSPLERPQCPKCGARMIRAQTEDREDAWVCLACGTRVPIKDEAREAALAADALAAREWPRKGPGRPKGREGVTG